MIWNADLWNIIKGRTNESLQLTVSMQKIRFYYLLVSMPLRTLLPMLSAWQVCETLTFERSLILEN
jgi:hypothetical protein